MSEAVSRFVEKSTEEQVLGSLLLGFEAEGLDDWHFHYPAHREIYRAIERVRRNAEPVLISGVEAELKGVSLNGMDAGVALVQLETRGSIGGLQQNADRLRDLATRRMFVHTTQDALQDLFGGEDPDVVRGKLNATMDRYLAAAKTAGVPDIGKALDHILDRYADPVEVWGLRSGIDPIDHHFGGIHPGESMIIAGDPGVGKSIFVVQIAYQLAGLKFWNTHFNLNSNPGVIYELEMSEQQVINRLISALAQVEWKRLQTGKLDNGQLERVTDSIGLIESAPVHISDWTHWTTTSMRTDLLRHREERGIRWCVVDYIGLLKDPGDNQVERENTISRALHDIAKDLQIAVIGVSSLNKQGFGKNKGLEALRGSAQLSYDADVVAYIEKPGSKNGATDLRTLRWAKAREGDMFTKFTMSLNGAQKRFDRNI